MLGPRLGLGTRDPADALQKPLHLQQVPEVAFLSALEMPDPSPPAQLAV